MDALTQSIINNKLKGTSAKQPLSTEVLANALRNYTPKGNVLGSELGKDLPTEATTRQNNSAEQALIESIIKNQISGQPSKNNSAPAADNVSNEALINALLANSQRAAVAAPKYDYSTAVSRFNDGANIPNSWGLANAIAGGFLSGKQTAQNMEYQRQIAQEQTAREQAMYQALLEQEAQKRQALQAQALAKRQALQGGNPYDIAEYDNDFAKAVLGSQDNAAKLKYDEQMQAAKLKAEEEKAKLDAEKEYIGGVPVKAFYEFLQQFTTSTQQAILKHVVSGGTIFDFKSKDGNSGIKTPLGVFGQNDATIEFPQNADFQIIGAGQ
ncbi:MAG: hypothetical protein LBQ47_06840 [Endomicrobium sp.]|jgi:hypothetical protein|nr:hypothetical protein [Endomicrobium sp.]